MTKRIVLIAFTIALAGAVTVAPAQADERPCVSQREYRHVLTMENDLAEDPGWRQARVADHFDLHGTRIRYAHGDDGVDTVWKYRKCSAWGPRGWYVGVWYYNYTWGDSYMRAYRKSPNRPYALGAGFF